MRREVSLTNRFLSLTNPLNQKETDPDAEGPLSPAVAGHRLSHSTNQLRDTLPSPSGHKSTYLPVTEVREDECKGASQTPGGDHPWKDPVNKDGGTHNAERGAQDSMQEAMCNFLRGYGLEGHTEAIQTQLGATLTRQSKASYSHSFFALTTYKDYSPKNNGPPS
jgi:hypothetical protein